MRGTLRALTWVVCAASIVGAQAPPASSRVHPSAPWVRAPAPGARNAAVYLTVQNDDDREHRLVRAQADVSTRAEFHVQVIAGSMVRMERIPEVRLPPHQAVHFEAGGLHIMLTELNRSLRPGDVVKLTLWLEEGSALELEAKVMGDAGPAVGPRAP